MLYQYTVKLRLVYETGPEALSGLPSDLQTELLERTSEYETYLFKTEQDIEQMLDSCDEVIEYQTAVI